MALPLFKGENKTQKKMSVIAIAAGKGGVGKSTVTVNLALALKRNHFNVGILDADIYGPSLRRMLPENRPPQQQGQKIIPALCHGIEVISMAYFRRENEAAAVRAPIANGVISQFLKDVAWGDLDYLLIDFPPGTGDIQLTLSQHAHLSGAVMVATPQEIAIMDVRKAMHLFEQVQVPVLGVVENMSYYISPSDNEKIYIFGKGGGGRLALEAGVPFLGEIPIDPKICACCDSGLPLNAEDPSMQYFETIAESVIKQLTMFRSSADDYLSHFEIIWKEE